MKNPQSKRRIINTTSSNRIKAQRIRRTTETMKAEQPGENNTSVLDIVTAARDRQIPTFALMLDGNSLAPRYHKGDVLTISTETDPTPGEAVLLAGKSDGTPRIMILNADGDATNCQGGYMARDTFEILGAVTDVRPASFRAWESGRQ